MMVSGRDFACHVVKNTGQEAGGKVVGPAEGRKLGGQ